MADIHHHENHRNTTFLFGCNLSSGEFYPEFGDLFRQVIRYCDLSFLASKMSTVLTTSLCSSLIYVDREQRF